MAKETYSLELLKEGAWVWGWLGNSLADDDPWISDGSIILKFDRLDLNEAMVLLETKPPQAVEGCQVKGEDFVPTREALASGVHLPFPSSWSPSRMGPPARRFSWGVVDPGPTPVCVLGVVDPEDDATSCVDAWRISLLGQLLDVTELVYLPSSEATPWMVWAVDDEGNPIGGVVCRRPGELWLMEEGDTPQPQLVTVEAKDPEAWARLMSGLGGEG